MRYRTWRAGAVGAAAAGLMAVASGSAGAQTATTFKQVTFAPQRAAIKQMTAAARITQDDDAPVRGFTGPTSMLADPTNPRIVVAATANLRNKVCYLAVSRDAGHTWHFSKALPTLTTYPACTNATAGVPQAVVAWGRDGAVYYAHEAYGEVQGGGYEDRHSIVLARTTDLGQHWTTTLVDDNRTKTDTPVPSDSGVTGLAVDTSGPRDVVYVGFNQSYSGLPTDSPLRNPIVVVSTSIDAGKTFGRPVNLNTFPRPKQNIAGMDYDLYLRSGFGSPYLSVHNGTLLAVAGPDLSPLGDRPQPPPEAGSGLNPGSWYAYAMPQLIGRSTDQGKTWAISTLGPPIYAGNGSMTGIGWTPKGGAKGTWVAAYGGSPPSSPTTGLADILVQRSTDDGATWTDALAVDDDTPDQQATSFYPQLAVAPNGRVDVSWQDNRDLSDFNFNVRYSYSTDAGATWAPNVQINDRPVNFNYGISFNSDIRQPSGLASTNQYAIFGWADTRLADDVTQTQDNFSSTAQFSPLPTTKNTVAPRIAAVFAGLVVAGLVLLVLLQVRRRGDGPPPERVSAGQAVGAR